MTRSVEASERAAHEALYAGDPLFMACPDCIGGWRRYGDGTVSPCSRCGRTGAVRRTMPKRPEMKYADGVEWVEYYDPGEADAYIAWQAELIRDLLRDHQRIEPHHTDMCGLCKRAALAGGGNAS